MKQLSVLESYASVGQYAWMNGIHFAGLNGHHKVLEMFINIGCDIYQCGGWYDVMHWSILEQHPKCVSLLLKKGYNRHLYSLYHRCQCELYDYSDLLKCYRILLKHGVSPNINSRTDSQSWIKYYPQFNKVCSNCTEFTVCCECSDYSEALDIATQHNQTKIVKLLLKNGAKVGLIPNGVIHRRLTYESLLYYPSLNGRIEIVRLLLKAGTNPNPNKRHMEQRHTVHSVERSAKKTSLITHIIIDTGQYGDINNKGVIKCIKLIMDRLMY
jgi:ankyrin repeat protein